MWPESSRVTRFKVGREYISIKFSFSGSIRQLEMYRDGLMINNVGGSLIKLIIDTDRFADIFRHDTLAFNSEESEKLSLVTGTLRIFHLLLYACGGECTFIGNR